MAYKNDLQKYYVGFYGRPADPEGLEYWNDILAGLDVDEDASFNDRFALIMEDFAGEGGETSEYDMVTEGLTNEELVDMIYMNLFSREPGEDDGRDFWVNELDEGNSTLITIVYDIIGGIEEGSDDEAIFNAKLEVANYFTENLGDKVYDRDDIADAKGILFSVVDEDSADGAKTDFDDWFAEQPVVPPVEPGDGEAFMLTEGADRGPDFVGTSENDTFDAGLGVNAFGHTVNTLNSADSLDGAGGRDKLDAVLVQEGALTGTGARAIEPTTKNIEELYFNARETTLGNGPGNVVTIGATNMWDVDYIESKYSDADLSVRGLTTNRSDGGNTPLPEMTVAMNHTSGSTGFTGSVIGGDWDLGPWNSLIEMINDIAGNLPDYLDWFSDSENGFYDEAYAKLGPGLKYINGQFDASSMKVLFEQNYLVPDIDLGIRGVTFRIMNQDAHDATVGDPSTGALNLDGVYVFRMEFEVDGNQYDLAPFIAEDANGVGDEFQTEAELVDHIRDVALPALKAANPDDEALQTVEVRLGNTWQDADRNRPGREIELRAPAEYSLTTRDVWLQVAQAEDPNETLPPEYGSNRIERVGEIDAEETQEMGINIELEKVGRGDDGGGMVVGGDNYTKGFDKFDVYVRGDDAKPSSLAYLLSTPHGSLEEMYISTHEDYVDGDSYADLTIGNSNTPVYSILDVEYFDATDFLGTLTVNYAVINAPNHYTYLLSGNNTDDLLSMFVSDDALNTQSSSLIIRGNDGDNTINVNYMMANGVDGFAPNTDIDANNGDNTVVISDVPDIATPENFGIISSINTGSGDDAVFLDGHFAFCEGTTNTWTVYQNTGAQYNFFGGHLQLSFAGLESEWIEIDSNDFITTNAQLKQAVRDAIESRPELDALFSVSDAAGGGLQLNLLSGGAWAEDELTIDVRGPVTDLRSTDGFAGPGVGGYNPQGNYDNTADSYLHFPGLDEVMTRVDARELVGAWQAYFGPDSNVALDGTLFDGDIDPDDFSSGDGVADVDNLDEFLIWIQDNAADLTTNGNRISTGDNQNGWHIVNVGAGDDLIVTAGGAGTSGFAPPAELIDVTGGAGGFVTTTSGTKVVIDDTSFGSNTVAFNSAEALWGTFFDFSAVLDTTAADRGFSINDTLDGDDSVMDGFVPIPMFSIGSLQNGPMETLADWSDDGGGQHNSITYADFSFFWALLQAPGSEAAAEEADILENDVLTPPDSFANFGADELESALNYWLATGGDVRTAGDYFFDGSAPLDFDFAAGLGIDDDVSVVGAKFMILVGKDGEVIQNQPVSGEWDVLDPYVDWVIQNEFASGEVKVFTGEVIMQDVGETDDVLAFGNFEEHGIINLIGGNFDWADAPVGTP